MLSRRTVLRGLAIGLALLTSACNKPLPDNFDLAGLWCEGMEGLCLPDNNDHTNLYLFSQLALPKKPQNKIKSRYRLMSAWINSPEKLGGEHTDYCRTASTRGTGQYSA